MAESKIHIDLIHALSIWLTTEHLIGVSDCILIDTAGSMQKSRPPKIEDFIPDLYVQSLGKYTVIIGEAKTETDLENIHTKAQIEAFLRYSNKIENGLFVLAVPFGCVPLANNLVLQIARKQGLSKCCYKVPINLPRLK